MRITREVEDTVGTRGALAQHQVMRAAQASPEALTHFRPLSEEQGALCSHPIHDALPRFSGPWEHRSMECDC